MKNKFYFLLPLVIIAALTSRWCYSDITNTPTSSNSETIVPVYTFIKDCKDTVNNDNAAYSKLSCPSLGDYQVNISEQSPQFFNIILSKGKLKLSTDFTVVSHDNPVEAGKAIEWHFLNNKPKYMIFRLSWGSEEEPFKMREYLVVNLVTEKNICALATVDVKKNKKSNQKARDLLTNKFKKTNSCPLTILAI